MKKHQIKLLNDYLEHGMITDNTNEFWTESYSYDGDDDE
jgi:hypothetical protein